MAHSIFIRLLLPALAALVVITLGCMFAIVSSVQSSGAEEIKEIRDILITIPSGREALKQMEEYQVGLKFRPGGGSFYFDKTNQMVIDANRIPVKVVFSFVHEMTHAMYHNTGMEADADSLSRQEYIDMEIEEEAEGEAKAIEAKMELEELGVHVPVLASDLEVQFREAFEAAVASAKVEHSGINERELYDLGREAGKQRIIKGFFDGELVGSRDQQTYPSIYGQRWDAAN